jgi:hypothetical protein
MFQWPISEMKLARASFCGLCYDALRRSLMCPQSWPLERQDERCVTRDLEGGDRGLIEAFSHFSVEMKKAIETSVRIRTERLQNICLEPYR